VKNGREKEKEPAIKIHKGYAWDLTWPTKLISGMADELKLSSSVVQNQRRSDELNWADEVSTFSGSDKGNKLVRFLCVVVSAFYS
jgi:hypothetical protein